MLTGAVPAVLLALPAGVGNLVVGARGYRTGAGVVVLGFVTSVITSISGHFLVASERTRLIGVCLEIGSLLTLTTAIWASRQPLRPDDG